MLMPTKSDGLSRGSHYTRLKVPAAKRFSATTGAGAWYCFRGRGDCSST